MKKRRNYSFQKKKGFKFTISAVVLIVLTITVGYATFNTSLYSNVLAFFRADSSESRANMRITSVTATGTSPAIVSNMEYSSDTITSDIVLPSSKITFSVTVKNYGSAAATISDISLSDTYASNISIGLTSFSIGDSIAANESKTFTVTLTLSGSTTYSSLQSDVPLYFTFSTMSDYGADINLKVYLQNRDSSTGTPVDGYTRVYFIPETDYTYDASSSSCLNGSTLAYDSTNYKFTVNASGKDTCSVFFTATSTETVKGSPNTVISLYIEQTDGEGDYAEVGEIPTSHTYSVNTSNTTSACSGATVDNTNHVLNLSSSSNVTCSVYLDIES